jgi:ureidoglycolate lyase
MDRQVSTGAENTDRGNGVNTLRLFPLTADAISPFGSIIESPTNPGDRTVYTQWLGSDRTGMTPRLHTNSLHPTVLPYAIQVLERHPYSAQLFLPLDVAQYVVVVAPTADDGTPDLMEAHALLAPGNIGIVYAPAVWHAPATVLERQGTFAVVMWRNDTADDEEFTTLASPIQIRLH